MGIKPETLHNAELKDKVFSGILIFFKQLPLSEHSHHCYKIFKAHTYQTETQLLGQTISHIC